MQRKSPERISRGMLIQTVETILKQSPESYQAFRLYRVKHEIMPEVMPKVFGKSVVSYLSDFRMKNREMTIRVSSAALKHNLIMLKNQVIGKINEEMGEEFVENIVFL